MFELKLQESYPFTPTSIPKKLNENNLPKKAKMRMSFLV